jgi:hypothetical protein
MAEEFPGFTRSVGLRWNKVSTVAPNFVTGKAYFEYQPLIYEITTSPYGCFGHRNDFRRRDG